MNHSLLDYGVMWAASFALVFLLGIQSKNVQRSQYVAAIITSFGISIGNFTFIKYAAVGTMDAFWVCAAGGCMGIAFSIWFADNVLHNRQKEPQVRRCDHGEGSAQLTPETRSTLECASPEPTKRTPDALIDIERHMYSTGIPMPGEKNA